MQDEVRQLRARNTVLEGVDVEADSALQVLTAANKKLQGEVCHLRGELTKAKDQDEALRRDMSTLVRQGLLPPRHLGPGAGPRCFITLLTCLVTLGIDLVMFLQFASLSRKGFRCMLARSLKGPFKSKYFGDASSSMDKLTHSCIDKIVCLFQDCTKRLPPPASRQDQREQL